MYYDKNFRPFSDVCNSNFGRKVIYTNSYDINKNNIVKELQDALSIHNSNAREIRYLDNYYRGDQPILYAKKVVRPNINNKIVENHAYELVEAETAEIAGEPIQYALRGTDETKSALIKLLNDHMVSEDKSYHDVELCRWQAICGTAYRFVPNDNGNGSYMDETPFAIRTENPANTFVVYQADTQQPMYSCQIRKDNNDKEYYFIYTNKETFKIQDDKIIESGINGNFMIPVIEYPRNERRLSAIEITITITDALNKMQSNRLNGIEQFIQAFMKFKNCEIDTNEFLEMAEIGAISIKDAGSGVQSDVDLISSELNQQQAQIAKDDMYQNFLLIQGRPGRQENSGGDTGQAVVLRNGYYDAEKRAELREPIFKKSERNFLRVVLNRLRIKKGFALKLSDIEIKIVRSKTENMTVKANVLKLLLDSGIAYSRAIKTIDLFSDPEEVAIESRDRMEYLYSTKDNSSQMIEQNTNNDDNLEP